jgi:hypothetical protein
MVARFLPRSILALGDREHLLVARAQARRPREPMQIVGAERRGSIGERERLECVVPFAALEMRAPALEWTGIPRLAG